MSLFLEEIHTVPIWAETERRITQCAILVHSLTVPISNQMGLVAIGQYILVWLDFGYQSTRAQGTIAVITDNLHPLN